MKKIFLMLVACAMLCSCEDEGGHRGNHHGGGHNSHHGGSHGGHHRR